ncbi:hypothetical protein GTY75_07095 [Streptomyces sp. SID8381]|uniref:hypothetical protein n=1 Tax=unclassified Streptomyces TaxID=2593676 RepID=UPI000378E2A4|nr:hypothetical protein [Streptomyces sp. Amel2xE9]MYX26443.1 hypothetical protein [Streptomyces sp. SID8381]
MITPADETLPRRAIGIAARAVEQGDAPYDSLPAAPDGAALATDQLIELNPESGQWPTVAPDGPALFEEARVPIERYYRPS